MKKIKLLTIALLFFGIKNFAQVSADLDANNIKARLNSGGDLFWDFSNAKFEAPKGSGINSIFAANLWIGGMDGLNQLHVAAQTYRQNGTDFWPGPLDTVSNDIQPSVSSSTRWNRVWKINRSTIDSFSLGQFQTIPQCILDWPGNGDPVYNQDHLLAPYVDVNANGNYDPSGGDYPIIKGDQAVFFIYNDHEQGASHGETGGVPLGVEVHGMAYVFKCTGDSALDNTVFINYKIINRRATTYSNSYIGMWTDFDIGYYADDYVGCDVTRNYFFGYNGDSIDGNGGPGTYGSRLGAQGVVFLNGPLADAGDGVDNDKDCIVDEVGERNRMEKFISYNNDASVMGNPTADSNYYNLLRGRWRDNTPMTYGGSGYGTGLPCDYMFPDVSDLSIGWGCGGNCSGPVPTNPWSESSGPNPPGDRRGIGSSGSFTMQPGSVFTMDLAFVFSRDYTSGGVQQSLNLMNSRVDSIQAYFDRDSTPCGGTFRTDVKEHRPDQNLISVYPNPTSDILFVSYSGKSKNVIGEIYDVTGKKMLSVVSSQLSEGKIDVSSFASGLYFIRIIDGEKVYSKKFVKE